MHLVILEVVSLFVLAVGAVHKGPDEGRGSGDTLDHAVAMALEDAVLNAGGKIGVNTVVHGEKLEKNEVKASNTVYLVNYTILNQRESEFDGVNVTVKASFSDMPYQQEGDDSLKGIGNGPTERAAIDWALANLLGQANTRIQVYVECEEDEIKRDEADFVHRGYVESYEKKVKSTKGGYTAEVFAEVRPEAGTEGEGGARELTGCGMSDTCAVALALAREDALRCLGADYFAVESFREGEQSRRVFERTLEGSWNNCRITSLYEKDNQNFVSVELSGCNGGPGFPDVLSVFGNGFGETKELALEYACRDAVLNWGSRMRLHDVLEDGLPMTTECQVEGAVYLEYEEVSSKRRPGGWHVNVKSARTQPSALIKGQGDREGFGLDARPLAASIRARTDAIVGAGAVYSVEQTYKNGRIENENIVKLRKGTVSGFSSEDKVHKGRHRVSARMRQDVDPGQTCTGFGEGTTERAAILAARYDALLNGGCEVSAVERYDVGGRVFEQLDMKGDGFVGPAKVCSMENVSGVYCARIQAAVWNKAEEPSEAVQFGGVGVGYAKTMAGALAAAKVDQVFNAGTALTIDRLSYVDRMLKDIGIKGRGIAYLDDYEVIEASCDGDRFKVGVRGGLWYGPREKIRIPEKVLGHGYGETEDEAVMSAKVDAALNARGRIEFQANWDGKVDSMSPSLMATWANDMCLVEGKDSFKKTVPCDFGGYRAQVSMGTCAMSCPTQTLSVSVRGYGNDINEAIADARKKFGFNAGVRIRANMELDGTTDGTVRSVWSNDIVFSRFEIGRVAKTTKGYVVLVNGIAQHYPGRLNLSDNMGCVGVGFARTADEAFKRARMSAILDRGGRGIYSATYKGGKLLSETSDYSGAAELHFESAGIDRARDGGFRAWVKPRRFAIRKGGLGVVNKEVIVCGFGSTKEEAIEQAKENAVAAVFGRVIRLVNSNDSGVPKVEESLSQEGYVDEFDVEGKKVLDCGLTQVEISAKVKSHLQDTGWSIWKKILVGLLFLFILHVGVSLGTGGIVAALVIILILWLFVL